MNRNPLSKVRLGPAVLSIALAMFAPAPAQEPAPSPQAPAPPSAQAVPPAQDTSRESLLSTADTVLQQMSSITGLPIREPLRKRVLSRAEVTQYLTENLHREYTPEEIHAQEATLKAFGLLPRDADLEKLLVAFYTEQAAGFYDPRRKTMFIADWVSADLQRMVLAHELTHALQDQSFDLDRFIHAVHGNDDAESARQAVVEGQAMAAMMQQALGPVPITSLPSLGALMDMALHQQMQGFPAFSNAPFFFRFEAMFPYSQGMSFIQAALAKGGWSGLSELFTRPPATTREIFDPAAYFRHDPPPAVSLPHPPALTSTPHLKLVADNTLGELSYYSLLGQLLSEDEAKRVTPNWRGDRYLVYENEATHDYTLVVRSRWSSADAASAFFTDEVWLLKKRFPNLKPDASAASSDDFTASTAQGPVIVLHRGLECLWAEGVPAGQFAAVRDFLDRLSQPPQAASTVAR
jgi:Putative metallopeptidase family (DUF6782)